MGGRRGDGLARGAGLCSPLLCAAVLLCPPEASGPSASLPWTRAAAVVDGHAAAEVVCPTEPSGADIEVTPVVSGPGNCTFPDQQPFSVQGEPGPRWSARAQLGLRPHAAVALNPESLLDFRQAPKPAANADAPTTPRSRLLPRRGRGPGHVQRRAVVPERGRRAAARGGVLGVRRGLRRHRGGPDGRRPAARHQLHVSARAQEVGETGRCRRGDVLVALAHTVAEPLSVACGRPSLTRGTQSLPSPQLPQSGGDGAAHADSDAAGQRLQLHLHSAGVHL
jgi:hypothetical protein